jgi:hypothetical protein
MTSLASRRLGSTGNQLETFPRQVDPLRGSCRRGTRKGLHFSSANGNVDLWNILESRGVKAL